MGIFISYSNRDGDAVRVLARDLEAARQTVWLDQDLKGGAGLLRSLRGRNDVTVRSAGEIDTILARVGGDRRGGGADGGPTAWPGGSGPAGPTPGSGFPPGGIPGQHSGGGQYRPAASFPHPGTQARDSDPSTQGQGSFGKPGSGSNSFSIVAMVCGAIALLILPILFGPAAIALAIVGINRGEPMGKVALGVAIAGMLLGFIFGFLISANL